jgi:hypothetical protein
LFLLGKNKNSLYFIINAFIFILVLNIISYIVAPYKL